jgi:IPT/TIG domain
LLVSDSPRDFRLAFVAALALVFGCAIEPKELGPPRRPPPPTAPERTDAGAAAGAGMVGRDAAGDGEPKRDGGAASPALPTLTGFAPASVRRGEAASVELSGEGFGPRARVFVNGTLAPATALSQTKLRVTLPAAATEEAGFHAVFVEVDGDKGKLRSNVAYLTVPAPRGWPEITDLHPDNALPGERVRIVGFNLTAEKLTITDPAGRTAEGGVIGTLGANDTVRETVELTIPADWQSGPILVGNSVGRFRGKALTVGRNLAQLPGAKATASSEYGGEWTIARGADNNLATSWFTAAGDCVSAGPMKCKTTPWFMITLPAAETVARIAVRGNREYTAGYDFLRARLEVLGEGDVVLWSGSYALPEPDRDLDLTLPAPVPAAKAVRFTSERDESPDPGFGELAIFGP